MKKTLVFILLITFTLSLTFMLVSCKTEAVSETSATVSTSEVTTASETSVEKTTTSETAATEETKAGGKTLVGFANLVEGYALTTVLREGIDFAAEDRGWDIIDLDNNVDPQKALENADIMINKGVNLAIEFQYDATVMPALMEKFNNAKIPVVAVDIPAPGATFVGVNNFEAGKLAGKWLGEYVKNNWGGDADLVIFLDSPSQGEAVALRVSGERAGFLEILPEFDQSKMIQQDGKGLPEGGLNTTRNILTAFPNAKRIILTGLNDACVTGGISAAEQLKRTEELIAFGQGCDDVAEKYLRDNPNGPLKGSVGYFFEDYSDYIFKVLDMIVAGEKPPTELYIRTAIVTPDNVKSLPPYEKRPELVRGDKNTIDLFLNK